jgi:ABC-2 type transport system permease protein
MSIVNTYKALIKREFWEHRGAFVKTPIIISIVMLVLIIGGYFTSLFLSDQMGSGEFTKQGLQELTKLSQAKLAMFWSGQIVSTSVLFIFVLFIVMFFYILGSLYNDRKDQSILFWKSLPISDAQTVASKLLTATLVVPFVYSVVVMLFSFILMVFISIVLLIHGFNPIDLVWSPANLFQGFLLVLTGVYTQMFWALPIYAWLMFSSSFNKKRPFLFAVFVPSGVALGWYWINMFSFKFTDFTMFKQPLYYLGHSVFPFASGTMSDKGEGHFSFDLDDDTLPLELIGRMSSSVLSLEVLYGMIFASIFIAIAIWIRRYRNTT